jgi:hypothetical protein
MEKNQQERAIDAALEVARKAAEVARTVAATATEVAASVAKTASEASQGVMLIANDISYIKSDVKSTKDDIQAINAQLDGKYVTKEAFAVVKGIAFGLVGLMVVAVVTALLSLVIKN